MTPTKILPTLFIGHGSPMNAIEENEFTREWKRVADSLPTPKVILCISAHWLTRGTYVTHMLRPKTIHDFGGFPPALSAYQYPAQGSPEWAEKISAMIETPVIQLDESWGLDHGAWSILTKMYPMAEIPVLQMSIDYYQPPQFHYNLGKQLKKLREQGVLILGSGNIVHNLGLANFSRINEVGYGFDWALEMQEYCNKNILAHNHQALIDYEKFGRAAKLAVPTPDHYYPLLYVLGTQAEEDKVSLFNDRAVAGSLTMTSVLIETRDPK